MFLSIFSLFLTLIFGFYKLELFLSIAVYFMVSSFMFLVVCADYVGKLAKEKMPHSILLLAFFSSFGWCAFLLISDMSSLVASISTTVIVCISQNIISHRIR